MMASKLSSSAAAPSSSSSSMQSKQASFPITSFYQQNLYSCPSSRPSPGLVSQSATLPNGAKVSLVTLEKGHNTGTVKDAALMYVLRGEATIRLKREGRREGGEEVDKAEGREEEARLTEGHLFWVNGPHTCSVGNNSAVTFLKLNELFDLSSLSNSPLLVKNMKDPAAATENRQMTNFTITSYSLSPSIAISLGTFSPQWDWEKDVKPIAQTPLCMHTHVVFPLSGNMMVRMKDGKEYVMGPGELCCIPPEHGGRCVSKENAVALDFGSMLNYARGSEKK